tara:strand:+ start:1725 stop:1916 length:192 start_codon:yes stop_codon:yes gene_type:complete
MKKSKVIFLKFKSNKNELKLKKQIETVLNYLCKRYDLQIDKMQFGIYGDDFINGIERLKVTFK